MSDIPAPYKPKNTDAQDTQYFDINSSDEYKQFANTDPNIIQPNQQQRPSQQSYPSKQRPPQQSYSSQQRSQQRPQQQYPQQQRPPQQRPQQQRPQQNYSQNNRPKKSKKSGGCLSRIILSLLAIFIVIFIIYSAVALTFIKQIDHDNVSLSHYSNARSESYVRNILIIGTDARDTSERGRSDSMILVSINSKSNQIFLTSLMRDSCVSIDGYGDDKLNHAYSYGGAELLIDTIERNFKVRIDEYVTVNFNAVASVVDAVDGIEIEISDAEAQEINTILMAEVNELMGDAVDDDLLDSGGKVKLNGKQALSYSRIRNVGNSDFERTERQRNVIMNIIGKIKPTTITSIMKSALPELSTNMSTSELYLLSLRAPFLLGYDFCQQRIPAEGTFGNTTADSGGAALSIDFQANIGILEDTIFSKSKVEVK